MKKIQSVIVLCYFICATSAMAANDRHVALCSLGYGMLANDVVRGREILSRADNKANAEKEMGRYIQSMETQPNGNFSESGAKKLIMDHSAACKAIGIKNALQ